MKTKIGEIKSYKDFFEIIGTEKYGSGDWGDILIDTLKCKLCGELFKDFNPSSAGDTRYSGQYERHIRLHETVKKIL